MDNEGIMEAIQTFLDNIKDLMTERGLTFEQLAQEVKIDPRTLRRWYGHSVPKLHSLTKISRYFGCSLEYLFGFTPEFDAPPQTNETFYARYKKLKREHFIKDAFIALVSGIAPSTISEWNDNYQPDAWTLLRLREAFGCTLDFLAGIGEY